MSRLFADLDSGGARHAVCGVDEAGKVVDGFDIAHDAEGRAALLKRLGKLGALPSFPSPSSAPQGSSSIRWRRPDIPSCPSTPVVKACRPRYRAAGGKHDAGDAYLIADLLRTDSGFQKFCPEAFRKIWPASKEETGRWQAKEGVQSGA